MNDDSHVVRGMEAVYEAFKMLNELVSTRKQKQKPAARAAVSKLMGWYETLTQFSPFSQDVGLTWRTRLKQLCAEVLMSIGSMVRFPSV